jgi:hypothetical protein
MKSPTFTVVVGVMTGLAVIGTLVSAVAVYRSTRKRPPPPQMVNRSSAATPP